MNTLERLRIGDETGKWGIVKTDNRDKPQGPPTIIAEPMAVLHEADRDIEAGRVKRFKSDEEMLRELER